MHEVEFYRVGSKGEDERVGVARWDGKEVGIDPVTDPSLRDVLETPVWDPKQKRIVSAETDPENWLRWLHLQYRAYCLRASQVKTVDGK